MLRLLQSTLILSGLFLLCSTAAVAYARESDSPTWLYFTSDFALYRMYPDGSHVELLMDDVKMYGGTWSPDAQWLVFSGNHDYGFADLYRFNVYTRRLELIAATDLSDGFVEWTPNNRYIVFEADTEEYYQGYYLMRPDGSERRELLGEVRLPNYVQLSPDGEWVLYDTGWEQVNHVFLEKIEGTETRQLTDFSTGSRVWRVTPDDEWILFTTSTEGSSDIFRMRWDGSEKQNITHAVDAMANSHLLSPDGQWIIMTTHREPHSMHRVHIDGSQAQHVHSSTEHYNYNVWSSDSQWMYFTTGFEDGSDLYRVNVASGEVETLVDSDNSDRFIWLSPDDRWLYYSSTTDFAIHELVILDLEENRSHTWGVYPHVIGIQFMSQDGEWVYFIRSLGDDRIGFYRMHIDGTNVQHIMDMSPHYHFIGWSPQLSIEFTVIPLSLIGMMTVGCGGLIGFLNRRRLFRHHVSVH